MCYCERGLIPPYYIFQFQLNRLSIHPRFGYLIDVSEQQRLMNYAFDIIVKIFIGNVLIRPWKFTSGLDQIKDTPQNRHALKQIASILYYLIMEFFAQRCPIINSTQEKIPEDLKIIAVNKTMPIIFDNEAPKIETHTAINCITGLFDKNQLAPILEHKPDWLNQLEGKLEAFLLDLDQMVLKQNQEFIEGVKNDMVKENLLKLQNLPPYLRK